ncbi:DUF4258 domain-containing protein [Candidatus Parcubacteria bacterium]|nr:MAG: DUF4258 domain-containing protein [Candidatus Parcubacteria bacterium]
MLSCGISLSKDGPFMDAHAKEIFIRECALHRKIRWSRHALGKLASMPFLVEDVEQALQQAEVIEDYPHLRRYLPDCLVLAFVPPRRPIHCVIALNEPHKYILIVTVYVPDEQEWSDDWKTRK